MIFGGEVRSSLPPLLRHVVGIICSCELADRLCVKNFRIIHHITNNNREYYQRLLNIEFFNLRRNVSFTAIIL